MPGKSLPLEADIDLEAQYNNRAAVPDHPAVMARWKTDAQAARQACPPQILSYGPGARETLDLFEAGPVPRSPCSSTGVIGRRWIRPGSAGWRRR